MLAAARAALQNQDLSEAQAVHELRKAFKRWRALLRILEGPVGASAARMRGEGRELMRLLSGARDAQSALDAVADIQKGETALSPVSLESVRARLAELRDAAERAGFTDEMRARIARHLDEAEAALAEWALEAISFAQVADALAATYRRARRLVPEHWRKAKSEQLHALRRRVVEHRHQMELIEPLWPRLGKLRGADVQRLRNQLGAYQDLAQLDRLIGPHQPLARWRSRLAPAIAARRAAHLRSASRLAERLFAEKPKVFRARLGELAEIDTQRKSTKSDAQRRR